MNIIAKHLTEVVDLKKINFSSRLAKRVGEATFKELSTLLQLLKISNESNREVELKEEKTLLNKLNHLVRFVSGISSKSQMLITILRHGLDDVGYIRDDGTLSGLALIGGEFYEMPTFTPNELIEIIENIDEEYSPSNDDREFIDMVEGILSKYTDEQKNLKISWKDIVESNEEIKKYYFATTLSYEINLLTMNQHQLDMRNANLQPNPWIAFQYYWVPNKLYKEYKEVLLGSKLFEFVADKAGLAFSSPGKILGKLNPKKKAMKKADQLKSLVLSYIGSEFCSTKEEFKEFIKMVARFGKYNDVSVNTYWSKMFTKLVKEVSYSEITKYYEDKYLKVYSNTLWGHGSSGPNYAINKLVKKTNQNTCEPIDKFNISRTDHGVIFISYSIWAKGLYGKGWDKTIELIVNQYISILEGKVDVIAKPTDIWASGSYDMWEALQKGYIKTAIESRINYVFGPMMDGVEFNVNKKKQDRYHESVLRNKSMTLHFERLESEFLPTRITLFPLASNGSLTDTKTINFGKGDGLQWLHPNDDENMAKDGFLGVVDDNLVEPFKSMDWSPFVNDNSQYWKLLLDHNEDKVEKLEGHLQKKVKKAIETIEYLSELQLKV